MSKLKPNYDLINAISILILIYNSIEPVQRNKLSSELNLTLPKVDMITKKLREGKFIVGFKGNDGGYVRATMTFDSLRISDVQAYFRDSIVSLDPRLSLRECQIRLQLESLIS